jgi:glucokinase
LPAAEAEAEAGGRWIGVDVGGTKVLAGVVADDGTVVRTARRSTPGRMSAPELVEEAVVDAVLAAADCDPVAGVGIAAAGFVSGHRVRFAPHLPWRGEDVVARLVDRLGVPVALDNDANCAAVAEATYGAGQDAASFLLVTLGTGIGGAVVLDGRVWRGGQGMAGEFGHMQVVPDGVTCECGRRGCWEQYCSGKALVRHARELMATEPSVLHELCDGDPARLTGPMVTEAVATGDLVARAAFARIGEWLGVGLANLVAALDPQLLVVGGGVSEAGDRLLDPARAALARSLVGAEHRDPVPVRAARLGSSAGLVGAALLAHGQLRR